MSQSERDAGEASTSAAKLHVENANRSVWLLKVHAFVIACLLDCVLETASVHISTLIYPIKNILFRFQIL